MQEHFGLTYLYLAVVRAMSDRIAVMQAGRIVELGSAEEVYRHPREEYTQALLDAVPVADPRLMKTRKRERRRRRAEAAVASA